MHSFVTENKAINEDFQEILNYSHFWNWFPDWNIVKAIYNEFPDSYSVLTPFAYTYLEELIRTTTSDYGIRISEKTNKPIGMNLINLAIKENDDVEYLKLLEEYKKYFKKSSPFDRGDNRNSVNHGYTHPREWTKESFENLIHDIARISKYSKF